MKSKKIAVVGSRGFDDYNKMKKILDGFDIKLIVSGGAKGADSLAERYAVENDIETIIFEPEWNKYGMKAGYLRNIKIVDSADIIIAFWDGESKGTLHSINWAKKTKKGIRLVLYKEN